MFLFNIITITFLILVYFTLKIFKALSIKVLRYFLGKVPKYRLKKIYVKHIYKDINGYLYETAEGVKGVGLALLIAGLLSFTPLAATVGFFPATYTMFSGAVVFFLGVRLKLKMSKLI